MDTSDVLPSLLLMLFTLSALFNMLSQLLLGAGAIVGRTNEKGYADGFGLQLRRDADLNFLESQLVC